MQSDLKDQQQAATLLYIMALSLINELRVETTGIELLRNLPLRDSLIALQESIDAISVLEDNTRIAINIKQIFIIAQDANEAADIAAILGDIVKDRSAVSVDEPISKQDDSKMQNEQKPKMEITLTAIDYEADPFYGDIYRYLRDDILPNDDRKARDTLMQAENKFIGEDGLLYNIAQPRGSKRGKREEIILQKVVPARFVPLLLQYMHVASGHSALDKLFGTIKRHFTFHKAYTKTMEHINGCHRCSLLRHQKRPKVAPLRPIRAVELFEQLSIDLINYTRPTSSGYRNIFAACDYLSGYAILAPMKGSTAQETLQVLVDKVLSRIGYPNLIHSDRGSNFQAEFADALHCMGIRLNRSSSKHPMSNGFVERLNSQIHQKLRAFGA